MSGIKSTKFNAGQVPSIASSITSGGVSQSVINTSQGVPQVSALMARSVSEQRRESLTNEVQQGLFKDGSGPSFNDEKMTSNAIVASSVGMNKFAQVVTSGWSHRGGEGDVVKQTPEVYSPLWLNSNLNLPRDRPTINAWCRSFYALNPFVHNSINLHSTYPISKLNIKCHNKEIEKFFNDMIEEIDLMNICVQIAQEYWLLGESFVYAELDESAGKWSRLLIQNPDYMVVKRTVVANEPIIMLRPDDNLKKIIFSNRPADIEQRKQLNQLIVDSVRRGNNIPLDNFNVSHLARRISPYEIRGTGLPVCIFRQLMLFDKLRECYSTDSEVLTDKGFKKITDLVYQTSNIELNPNYVNGIETDENGQISSVLTMKEDFKVACVNPETNEIEYHKPTELYMSQYTGKMLHFHGKKIDTLVSPNHKMWVKEQTNGKWGPYQKRTASDLLQKKKYYKFNCKAEYITGNEIDSVNICGKDVPIDLYLKVLGYVVSEGCVYENFKNNRYDANVTLNQLSSSDCYLDMRQSFEFFADKLNKQATSNIKVKGSGYSKNTPKEMWQIKISGKDLTQYFKSEIGTNGSTKSEDKHLPRWVLDLKPELLNILLESLMLGDGSESRSKYGTNSKSYKYSTISKQLSDDVYELVYKCGYVPNICVSTAKKSDDRVVTEYIVMWSDTDYGNEPLLYTGKKSNSNNGGGAIVEEVDYDGVVWCFEVPTGLFITRRNGKISIQGNSKYAQADNMINPLTLVKIGSEQFKPTFADIEAWKNVFECYDEETEVLTDQGYKKFSEVIDYEDSDDTIIDCKSKDNIKIACFNPDNEMLEYHTPERATLYNYDGNMYHYKNDKIDIKVTPNHDMWVSNKQYEYNGHKSLRKTKWGDWRKVKAKDLNLNDYSKFRSHVNWEGNNNIKTVNVIGHDVPIELYLEYLGYVLSEGCLYEKQYMINICQTTSKYYDQMRKCADVFGDLIRLECHHYFSKRGNKQEFWSGSFYNRDLFLHFKNECGYNFGNVKCYDKRVPRWIFDLSPRLLNILLDALVKGDGSIYNNPNGKSKRFAYYSTSKQLADDVYELVYKCGYVPTSFVRNDEKYLDGKNQPLYTVLWSTSEKGKFPLVYKTSRNSQTKEKHNLLNVEKYKGKVWCLTVPTGLFITRRNGKVGIHGNSAQYDKDFKIFTHEGVAVERVGYGQGIYDISNDITQIIKEIYVGLQVPSVLMDGGADTTYANGGVALDVLRQRYMQFRNMLSSWLRRKIFAPISKIQGFYDYDGGEKQLIVPEVDWNHMSIFDAGDYIQNLITLTTGEGQAKRASLHTLYRSLGLEYEDEVRRMRKESIQAAISKKEQMSLDTMDLNALRALDDDDEIPEPEVQPGQMGAGGNQPPLPGESPLGGVDMGGGLGGLPPMPPGGGGGLGGLPEVPMGGEAPPAPEGGGEAGGGAPPAPPA